MSGENLFSNLLTIGILFTMGVIVYAKASNKTLVDIVRDIREITSDKAEEAYAVMPDTFQDIR